MKHEEYKIKEKEILGALPPHWHKVARLFIYAPYCGEDYESQLECIQIGVDQILCCMNEDKKTKVP